MRRAHFITALCAGLAAVLFVPAAQAGPFYFVGKLGNTDTSVNVSQAFPDLIDGDDNSVGYGLGLKLGRNLAFQVEYHDLGNVDGFTAACPIEGGECIPDALPVETDSSAFSLSVLPHLLLTRRLQVYGKLGVVSFDSDITVLGERAGDFLDQRSDEDLVYGAGLRLEIPGPIDAFAEYERIGDLFDTVAIGATWGF